jgi:hypothetical protein
VLLDVVQGLTTLALEVLELLNHLSEHALLQQVINELLVLLRSIESGENLHGVDDVSLLLGLLPLLFLHLLEVEEAALENELFAADALIDSSIVQLDHIILELDVLLGVVLEKLQISQ